MNEINLIEIILWIDCQNQEALLLQDTEYKKVKTVVNSFTFVKNHLHTSRTLNTKDFCKNTF